MTSSLFLIICGRHEPYVAERNIKDMGREETIRELAAGEWGAIDGSRFMVSSIIEFPTDRDVTDEFIDAARMLKDSERTHFTGQDRIDWEHDRARAIAMSE